MNPEISVVIASLNACDTISQCLRSLEDQVTSRSFEVIVVDSSTDGTVELIRDAFPHVQLHHFSDRKFPGDARNIGIAVAKGKIVAFIDADCRADNNWIEMTAQAHESPWLAIGGAIANASPEGYVGWAAYFCEFSRWMPQGQARWLDDMPTANLSYKRQVFDRYGGFIEGTYCSDTEFHWRIGRDGHRVRFEPSILVSHHCIDNLRRFLIHEYRHGRSFGRVHIRGQDLSGWSRAIKVAGAPLCPLRMLTTITGNNLKNRIYLAQYLAALPLMMVGVLCWSAGQVVSYATD